MKRYLIAAVLVASSLLTPSSVWAATYAVDKDHTTVGFKIRHLFSNVQGSFKDFSGAIEYEPGKPETWKVEAIVQAASIYTNQEMRDKHLRSPDFFDVEKYPTLTFKSTSVKSATPTTAKLEGLLTIHGVEKPAVLDLEVHGVGKDPWGNIRAGFTAKTRINRKDFGLTWNEVVESGAVLVGEEVDIVLEVEGIAK